MKEGAKWELYIPSDLAYGEVGAGGAIPPGAALVFQMEILQVHDEEVRIGRQKYPMEGQR
jgi:FKBP-type peptidyl-prolyl cis-trans isomerase FklB